MTTRYRDPPLRLEARPVTIRSAAIATPPGTGLAPWETVPTATSPTLRRSREQRAPLFRRARAGPPQLGAGQRIQGREAVVHGRPSVAAVDGYQRRRHLRIGAVISRNFDNYRWRQSPQGGLQHLRSQDFDDYAGGGGELLREQSLYDLERHDSGGLDHAAVRCNAPGRKRNRLHLEDQFGRLGRDVYNRDVNQRGSLPGFGGNGVSGWVDAPVGVGGECGDVGGHWFGQSRRFLGLFWGHDAEIAADVGLLRDAASDRCEQRHYRRRVERHGRGFLQVLHRSKTGRVPYGRTAGRHLCELSK